MDLYPKVKIARVAAFRFIYSLGLALLLWPTFVHADNSISGRDYLLPEAAKGGFLSRPSSIQSKQGKAGTQAVTSYQAFDGSSHQLVENRGRYVNVLTPQSYAGGPFFTADHIEELVDRLDILYAVYTELLQNSPSGDGLLTIAFVPQTCGMGCGLVGARGFEILSDTRNYEAIIRELDAGRLESVFFHEMAHNFDLHYAYLHYLPDHAHAWTEMLEYFAPFRYAKISGHGETPDDSYNSPVSYAWKRYIADETATWNTCVMQDSCSAIGLSANQLWAMLYYRVEAMHGSDAILDSFEFLKHYTRTHSPPVTVEAKEDLRILSLAMGAQANIACYMDTLKWPIGAGLRSELEGNFGSANELCVDDDGDGFSAVAGDCDDTGMFRNIAAPEIAGNGMDDDCDDITDETLLVEAQAGQSADNFINKVTVALPFEIEGSGSNPDDRDTFGFSVPESGRTRVTLCAEGEFKGWVVALQANGNFMDGNNWYSYRAAPGCISNSFDFEEMTDAGLEVIADESQGDYSLTVGEALEPLPDQSSRMQVIANASGGMSLQVDDRSGLLSSLGTDQIEVWISGIGAQLFKPFADKMTLELNNATVPGLQDGSTYQVRIRPRANGLPLAAFSAGHAFRYEQSPSSLPVIDHRFSGAWFDPEHDGEGFMVEVLEDNRAVVYWFTYQDGGRNDGGQRWMLGLGEVDGNRIVVSELLETRGGRFGADFDPDEVVFKSAGSLSLSFNDCSSAIVNYQVDNVGDHQFATRLSRVYGHDCNTDDPVPVNDISGSWYDPSHNGEGFVVQQFDQDNALVFWFTYDDSGRQSWMFNTGNIDNGSIYIPQLRLPKGGRFGRSFEPADVEHHDWGELTLELDCTAGSANYRVSEAGFSSGSQSLVPLTRLANSGCSE